MVTQKCPIFHICKTFENGILWSASWDCSLPFNVYGQFWSSLSTLCVYWLHLQNFVCPLPLQFEIWVQLKAVISRNNIPKSFHGWYLGYGYAVNMANVWNFYLFALHCIVGLDFMNLLVQLSLDHGYSYCFQCKRFRQKFEPPTKIKIGKPNNQKLILIFTSLQTFLCPIKIKR